jgi:hypothetical protein
LAAYTTTQAGPWNLTSTWGGSGPPGNGDTATIAGHAITIGTAVTVGSSPATGGTAALTMQGSSTLAINAGGSLILKGDLSVNALGSGLQCAITMAAGTSLNWTVPAGQTYYYSLVNGCPITCNGTSGSHCTVSATLGNSSSYVYCTSVASYDIGFINCTYTDFSNMAAAPGVVNGYGVWAQVDASGANTPITCTNCTFTASNYLAWCGRTLTWNGNVTVSNNKFSSSIAETDLGGNCCCEVTFNNAPSGGTRVVSFNSFDLGYGAAHYTNCVTHDNYFGGGLFFNTISGNGGAWGDETYFYNNFVVGGANVVKPIGGVKSCYFQSTVSAAGATLLGPPSDLPTFNIIGCIFENTNASQTGQTWAYYSVGNVTRTVSIRNCLVLPTAGTTHHSGVLVIEGEAYTTAVLEHNTLYCGDMAQFTPISAGWSTAARSGQVSSLKANFTWSDAKRQSVCYKLSAISGQTSGGNSNVVTPTSADYNGSYNGYTDKPSTWPSNSYTFAGNGYQLNFTAYPGAHDLADQDPQFVDRTRNLSAWSTHKGGPGTNADALARLKADPSLIAGDLMPWVWGGFVPSNIALKSATYPGDTTTLDAAGNAMNGTIGAIGYPAAAAVTHFLTLLGCGA